MNNVLDFVEKSTRKQAIDEVAALLDLGIQFDSILLDSVNLGLDYGDIAAMMANRLGAFLEKAHMGEDQIILVDHFVDIVRARGLGNEEDA